MDTENIIIYEGKLLRLNADVTGGLYWTKAKVISINQKNNLGEVEFKVPSEVGEGDIFRNKHILFKYIKNQGWLIDTESPFDLY